MERSDAIRRIAALWLVVGTLAVAGCQPPEAKTDEAPAPGTVDESFDPGVAVTNLVYAIAVQPDGKMVVGGGNIASESSTAAGFVLRLNADGTKDASFTESSADGPVFCLALHADGTLLAGGDFAVFGGSSSPRLVKLAPSGAVAHDFAVGTGFNGAVWGLVQQAGGKVVAAGYFTTYQAVTASRLIRLNADGGRDSTFNAGGAGPDGSLLGLASALDGSLFIVGVFTSYNGIGRVRVAKLTAEGALDSGFDPGTGPDKTVNKVATLPDGRVIIAGRFTQVGATARSELARLTASGALDTSFKPGTGVTGNTSPVYGLALQGDGKVLIGGYFNAYDGVDRFACARVNANGSLDTAFDPGPVWQGTGTVLCFALQGDGKILVGGGFQSYGGATRNNVARVWP